METVVEAGGTMTGAVEFGPFRLDPGNALLQRGAQTIDLAPKAFAVLCHLAARPGQLVTKNDLLDAIWGHRFVSESVLKTAINAIRSALGDDPRAPAYIETVARRGYRFIGAAAAGAPESPGARTATVTAAAHSPAPVQPAGAPSSPAPSTAATPAASGASLAPTGFAATDTTSAADGPAPSPLIGRAASLAWLDAHLAAVRRGAKQVVLVAGEAGIGKSVLVERFAHQARSAGVAVGGGQCIEQFGSGEPYLPLLDALTQLCRGPGRAAWADALRQVAPTWLAQLPWLVAQADQARLRSELAGAAQERMVREFGALLDAVTDAARPVVLVIEDLHWSDHATINLLGYLARRRGGGHWMVLATFRPTDAALNDHPLQAMRQELRLHRLVAETTLDAFGEEDVDAYLADRFGAANMPERAQLARELRTHTDGLPLFVANVVDELVDAGGLVQDATGLWRATPAAVANLRVPETIAGVVEKQIARLPGEMRSLLEAASVVGSEFTHLVLAKALGSPTDALQERCDGLARRAEWLNSAGMSALADGTLLFRYGFRHALYQRVFYERTEPAQRLQLHLRAAAALKEVHGAHADRSAAEIAVHFERAAAIAAAGGAVLAAALAEACTWRTRAARAAAALYAPVDALAQYEQALADEPSPAERARILAERSLLLLQTGAGPRAQEESAAALALARAANDTSLLHDVLLHRARVCIQADSPHEGLALVAELLGADPAPKPEQRIDALVVRADGQRALGQMQEADAALQAAAAACGDDAPERKTSILVAMVMAHYQRGAIAAGLAVADETRAHCERIGDTRGAATMLNRIGVFSMLLGQPERAEAALNAAREHAHALRLVDGERSAILNLVKLRTDRGDAEAALALLDAGWGLAPSFESPIAESAFLQGYYYCHYLRGELGAALADAERVLESAAQLNAVYWRAGAALLVFDLFVYLGDHARATALIDDALERTRAADTDHHRPKAILKRAWLDVVEQQPARALARLTELEATGGVEQPEDRAAIARVRAQAQLAGGDATAARTTLAAFDDAPTAEVWALLLALRLRAGIALRSVVAADLERARAEMRNDRLPRIEQAVLAFAMADALRAANNVQAAQETQQAAIAMRDTLAGTLAGAPVRRARFLAAFPPLA